MKKKHLNIMVFISGIYYLIFFFKNTSISSFKYLIKTWEGPQCQCLMCGTLN